MAHVGRFTICLVLSALLAPATFAGDPETAVVERVPFGDRVETKGTFVPSDAHEIKVELEAYSGPLEIEELAAFGPVKEGQTLIRFKRKWYERQVERMRLDAELSRLKFELQEKSFRRQQVASRLSKLEAERSYDRAKDDFAFFQEADEKMRFEERENGMQARRERLENQREELAQLEKMYGADDLTEETEEIVLKRAEKSMAFSERRHERWLKKTKGRDREDRQLKMEKAKLAFEKVMETADAELEQAYLGLKKARIGLHDLEEKLEKLAADEAQLELRAPVQGVLHPGGWSDGWKGYDEMRRKLEVGEKVKAGSAVMTVLPAGPLHVQTTVDEKDLLHVKPGLGAGIAPVADKSTTLRGSVTQVSAVGSKGKFAVKIALDDVDERIFPGMACEVSILTSTGSTALVVPARAITKRGDKTVVFVVTEQGPQQVAIVPGKARAGLVSVAKGLKEGERVLLDPPAQEPEQDAEDDAEEDDGKEDGKDDGEDGGAKDKRQP